MAQARETPTPGGGIVTDGLSFWLDAKNRGGIDKKWIEKLSSIEFTLVNAEERTDSVHFSGNGSFAYSAYQKPIFPISGTMEITAHRDDGRDCIIIAPNTSNNPEQFSVGPYGGNLIWSNSNGNYGAPTRRVYKQTIPIGANFSVSVTTKFVCLNSVFNTDVGGQDLWGGNRSQITIAGRSDSASTSGKGFCGSVFSIRYYNRQLTEAEILQNQQYDIDTYFGGVIPE